MSVHRFDVDASMVNSRYGAYVEYSDYAAVESERDSLLILVDQQERTIHELQEKLKRVEE